MKKLGICIPILNRKKIFNIILNNLLNNSLEYHDYLSIFISDNNSEDNLFQVYMSISDRYKEIDCQYSRSNNRLSPDESILRAVSMSDCEYTWIIGSDDFVTSSSLRLILAELKDDIDVVLGNVSTYNIDFYVYY
jgi:hypothetical protein